MTKQDEFFPDSLTETITQNGSSPKPLSLPATWTETWRRECEARDWLRRYQENGRTWWQETIKRIEQRRGKAAADQLRKDMNDLHGAFQRKG